MTVDIEPLCPMKCPSESLHIYGRTLLHTYTKRTTKAAMRAKRPNEETPAKRLMMKRE